MGTPDETSDAQSPGTMVKPRQVVRRVVGLGRVVVDESMMPVRDGGPKQHTHPEITDATTNTAPSNQLVSQGGVYKSTTDSAKHLREAEQGTVADTRDRPVERDVTQPQPVRRHTAHHTTNQLRTLGAQDQTQESMSHADPRRKREAAIGGQVPGRRPPTAAAPPLTSAGNPQPTTSSRIPTPIRMTNRKQLRRALSDSTTVQPIYHASLVPDETAPPTHTRNTNPAATSALPVQLPQQKMGKLALVLTLVNGGQHKIVNTSC